MVDKLSFDQDLVGPEYFTVGASQTFHGVASFASETAENAGLTAYRRSCDRSSCQETDKFFGLCFFLDFSVSFDQPLSVAFGLFPTHPHSAHQK